MVSDIEIKRDVEAEIQWDPRINETDVAISVKKGVVALAGYVPSFSQKLQAEADAKRVQGVVGVANDIEVRIPNIDQKPDPEIARDAASAIKLQLPTTHQNFKVVVKNGWLTLEGETEWQYLRERTEQTVHHLQGVKGVTNSIKLTPKVSPSEIKRKIEEAFKRSAEIDANRIVVETHNDEVVLKGSVQSWFERKEAERVAWSAPGVRKVDDRILIQA